MEGIQTHPSNAAQAKAFTAPGSLSRLTSGAAQVEDSEGMTGGLTGAHEPVDNTRIRFNYNSQVSHQSI